MLDIRRIRDAYDEVEANLERRKETELLERLATVRDADETWRDGRQELDELRRERNELGERIGELKRKGEDAEAEQQRAAEVSRRIDELEEQVEQAKATRNQGLMRLPNLLHESVPYGEDEDDNRTVRTWGEDRATPPSYDLLPHGELVERQGLADFERAAKVSGAGFVYLKGDLVRLNRALQDLALDHLVDRGFTPVETPLMMRRDPYEGVTDLDDFEDVMYKVEDHDEYLIATSEHPLGAMFQDEVVDEDELPVKLAGLSSCFRREIGSRGIDTKGLFRMHQFDKVEQFVFCEPEDSWDLHEELLDNAEHLFRKLELPYRVVNVCTGDIGTVAAKKYDIEAYSPRQDTYREVVSCSNCTGYQARRLNVRAGKYGGDKETAHTLNATAVATSRAMVMILENHQNEDGTVTVPEALRPYLGGTEVLGEPLDDGDDEAEDEDA
jgi:seryl-tRNA synthetase